MLSYTRLNQIDISPMDGFIALISFGFLSLFLVGMTKPDLFSFLFKPKSTRGKVGLVFGGLFVATFILFTIISPNEPATPAVNSTSTQPTSAQTTTTASPAIVDTEAVIQTHLVTRIIDGDTIEIEGGQRVRYIGINTPETVDPGSPVECFGQEASSKNKELLLNKRVRLEKDISETDKYGRLLRYVWLDDLFVNDYLVRQGYANSSSYPPDIKYQNQLVEAQREAASYSRGLWSSCKDEPVNNISTSTPVLVPTPTTTSTAQPPSSCTIKANISSSGEKIYHLPGCGSYGNTQIDVTKGEKWFCTEQEATQAGWRKALNC